MKPFRQDMLWELDEQDVINRPPPLGPSAEKPRPVGEE